MKKQFAAIQASLPTQVQEGPLEENPPLEDPNPHHQDEDREANIYEVLRQRRVQRAGDVDSLFKSMLPHIPLPFMQVQEELQQEALKVKCPQKRRWAGSELSKQKTLQTLEP